MNEGDEEEDEPQMGSVMNGNVEEQLSTCIMESCSSVHEEKSFSSVYHPSVDAIFLQNEPTSVALMSAKNDAVKSHEIISTDEVLKVKDENSLRKRLGSPKDAQMKVVSIVGNIGTGKSHTLNKAFFDGTEVFPTSDSQEPGTRGARAAYSAKLQAVVFDTEGLIGASSRDFQKMRLSFKVAAISNVVIYRVNAERLHSDVYTFLADFCKAYVEHFSPRICQSVGMPEKKGPSFLIFHETKHTAILCRGKNWTPEEQIKRKMTEMGLNIYGISSLEYVGTQTKTITDFGPLERAVNRHLKPHQPRSLKTILVPLQLLSQKFAYQLSDANRLSFPDAHLVCQVCCLVCDAQCSLTRGHEDEGKLHAAKGKMCQYQSEFENQIFKCKHCHAAQKERIVVPKMSSSKDPNWLGFAKYAWAGYVLECPDCGVIYRSRKYWYGNKEPVGHAVFTEITHVWPDGNSTVVQGTHNAARQVLDSVNSLSETINNWSLTPAKVMSSWVSDKLAPAYWRPNADIMQCYGCNCVFETNDTKHHCRSCGEGFCDECSSNKRPVPERGWGHVPVRVCDQCYVKGPEFSYSAGEVENENTARRVTEALGSTLANFTSAIDYPLALLKDSIRPAYWVPDYKITCCCICKMEFGEKLILHHCRSCGRGVCDPCSPKRVPVPLRGWDHPVRVCRDCTLVLLSDTIDSQQDTS